MRWCGVRAPHHSDIAPAAESAVADPQVGLLHLYFPLWVQCRCDAGLFQLSLLLLLPAVLLLLQPTTWPALLPLLLLMLTSCTYGTTASLTGINRT